MPYVEVDFDIEDYFDDFLDIINRDPSLMEGSGWVKDPTENTSDMSSVFEELKRDDILAYERMLDDLRARGLI